MRTYAAILAGGSGTRVGGETPKQLLPLGGKPVLSYSIAAFDAHPAIDGIIIVCREDLVPTVRDLAESGGYRKVRIIIPGGADRSGSSLEAIRAAQALSSADIRRRGHPAPEANILIHDAARPLIDEGLISRVVSALGSFEAVEPAIPVSDTVIRVAPGEMLDEPLDRSVLRAVQTPQGFRIDTILGAYRRMLLEPAFRATDDISVLRHFLPEIPVKVVPGSQRNIKLTHPSDLPVLEALLSSPPEPAYFRL